MGCLIGLRMEEKGDWSHLINSRASVGIYISVSKVKTEFLRVTRVQRETHIEAMTPTDLGESYTDMTSVSCL